MKLLVSITRILVGGLFIFSGLIKLNDPMGFAFKLQDYFAPEVLNLEFLSPYALLLSVIIVIFEIVLGVMVLIGYSKKFTVWSLFIMIVFFTFLTFYSAYFNKVTDCGCFGDAIKLTPWESFTKDVILLALILILFLGRKYIHPIGVKVSHKYIVFAVFLGCLFVANQVLNHLPYIDFRAYKIGTHIPSAMEIPPDAPRAKYDMTFIYDVNGEEQSFSQNELAAVPEGATFIERKQTLLQEGYTPPILDFTIENEDENLIDAFMTEEKLLLVIVYNLENSELEGYQNIKTITDKAIAQGYKVIGLSATAGRPIERLVRTQNLNFDFYFCDQTVLKTIVRSNPGIVRLENGTIKDKKHWNDALELSL